MTNLSCATLGFTPFGNGPEPVLVLHDWLGDHTNYDALLPYLDGATFTYVFVDLRGYGRSKHLRGCYTIDEIATDCLGVADALGWTRLHVVGHSMTGMATQRLAANVPSRIKSAVAVCPLSAAGNRLPPEAAEFFALTCENDDAFRRLVKFVTGGVKGVPDDWVDAKLRRNREYVAAACRRRYLDMMTTTDFVDEVRGLSTPWLVIVGDKDPGLDAEAMKQTFLAWHPNAQLTEMKDCGHYPMQTNAPAFATLMETFLSAHTR
ncbi:alpha/beta fold hydrolase [Pandoraea communis]|uniref:Alpha/beta hydrolase n=1 Tax=Pandoraea communis TaxID=2508297 RepID=A0A5E4SGQ8_9BURK|nr:alpha/beta hydrolase [Pandoraea communis]MDM8354767.1 alpha/beta hydrolase [Pandoraea communis]VVD73358.1 alpha/beta hydrolase [Pandoraea communis]